MPAAEPDKSQASQSGSGGNWDNAFDLYLQLAKREISESVKGSSLGAIWLVFNPILSMALYVVVFGVLFGGSFGRVENETSMSYAVGVYIGLSMVNLINETINSATSCLHQQRNLVKKVVFPLELLPAVKVAGSTFKLLVNTLLWLAMGAVFGSIVNWDLLILPLIFLPMVGIALGIAAFVSAVSVYFRDIQQLTSVITQIVFWSSGVFYSAERVQEIPRIWQFLQWNPVLLATENIRDIVLWRLPPDFSQIAFLYVFAVISLLTGVFVFHRLRPGFADFL